VIKAGFIIITPVFSVTWSSRNHSNMTHFWLSSVCVCRINQARVYLQAYRVGYKIQCPDKTTRWTTKQQVE